MKGKNFFYRSFLLILAVVLCACQSSSNIKTNEQSVHHEIGESVHVQDYAGNAYINIIYPHTDIELLDKQIVETVNRYRQDFENEIQHIQLDGKAELNIDYLSYVKDDRYISVKLDIFSSILENTEMIETFVYDQKEDCFVHLEDLFQAEAINHISELTRTYFETQFPDECGSQDFMIFSAPALRNFAQFILRKDAIVFYFDAQTLFDRSVYYEVPYEDLIDDIDLRKEEVSVFVPYQDILNEPIKHIDPDKPMVALTFDDGPTGKYTPAILDCLKEYQASATFFVVGSRASDYPEILQRMVLEGNEIGNHTYSHKQLTTLSKENIEAEITATQESIHDVTNQYPSIIRPPYGSKNATVMECTQGIKIATWTIDTEDWRNRDSEAIVNKVIQNVQDGDIILMHDLYATSASAAIILIPQLQEMGFQLVTVSELYEYGKNHAGKIMNDWTYDNTIHVYR